MNKEKDKLTPSNDLYIRVRASFIQQDTTFTAWCRENNINRQNAIFALRGGWRGPKARALVARIIKAAGLSQREAA